MPRFKGAPEVDAYYFMIEESLLQLLDFMDNPEALEARAAEIRRERFIAPAAGLRDYGVLRLAPQAAD